MAISVPCGSDARLRRQDAVLRNDDHAFVDRVARALRFDHAFDVADRRAVADARVLVDDRAFDHAIATDAERAARGVPVLVVVGAESHRLSDLRAGTDLRADADDRPLELRIFEAAT